MSPPNSYSPPEAQDASAAEHGHGSPIQAVIFGLLVDIGGSMLFGIICGAIYGSSLAASGMSAENIVIAAYSIQPDSWVFIVSTAGGAVFSILGGYVCARVAKRSEYRLGLILASLTTLLHILMRASLYSFVLSAILGAAGFALVVIGVRLGRVKNAAP
jgi:hypothetical protein